MKGNNMKQIFLLTANKQKETFKLNKVLVWL